MKKIINFRPILITAFSLCLGIVSAYFLVLCNYIAFAVTLSLCFIGLFVAVFFILKTKNNMKIRLIFTSVFSLFFVVGFISLYFSVQTYKNETLNNMTLEISGKVTEIREGENSFGIIIKDVYVGGAINKELKNRVEVYVSDIGDIELGDRITFESKLKERTIIYNDKFNAYSVADKIKFSTAINVESIAVYKGNKNLFQKINLKIKKVLDDSMDSEEFSVAYAMICGNSDFIDEERLTSYREAGIAHVFAVSGMHIGFLATALTILFEKFRMNKCAKTVSIVVILVLYAGICNFSSSSLRATIMTAVMLCSRLFGKKYDGLSSLSFSFILILLVSPIELFTVGFQLSFVIVFGIMLFSSTIARKLKFLPNKLATSIGAVISAQLFSFPIMLSSFGKISLISVLTNLVFLPVVGIVYIVTILTVIFAIIFGLGEYVLFFPSLIFKGVNFLITAFDYSVLSVGGFSLGFFAIFYYLAFAVVSDYTNLAKKIKLILTLVLTTLFISGPIISYFIDRNIDKIVITHTDNIYASVIYTPEESVLIVCNTKGYFSTSKIEKAMEKLNLDKINTVIFLEDLSKFDAQQKFTLLYGTVNAERVYYYGLDLGDILNTFGDIEFNLCIEESSFKLNSKMSFTHYGKFIKMDIDGKNIVMCSDKAKPSSLYLKFKDEMCDFMLISNYHAEFSGLNVATSLYSYTQSENLKNAQSYGNITYKLS